jgi:hypothetical protein
LYVKVLISLEVISFESSGDSPTYPITVFEEDWRLAKVKEIL